METIDWNDFISGIADINKNPQPRKEKTNIVCPKCGNLIYKICDVVFTSYPPKYKYECEECGWSSFA